MRKIFHQSILLLFLFGIIACGGSTASEEKGTGGESGHEEHEDSNMTILTQEQIRSTGINFGTVEQKQLTSALKANGTLQVPNQNKASVNSMYTGTIRTLLIQPGNSVTKGQVIASISNPEFITAQQEYLTTNADIRLAEQEYARQKELNEGNAGALKNLQAAEARLKAFRTRRSALQQQIQLMGINASSISNGKLISTISVRSPISGVVSTVGVRIGSFVDASTPIAEIVDNSQLHLDLFVYEKDLSKLRNNQTIHFTLTNNPGREYHAEIFSLGSSFEGQSKAVSVHARVKGDKTGLIDGMNIIAIISLDSATGPAVPSEAIVNYQGQDYIFIVGQDAGNDHGHKDDDDHDHKDVAAPTTTKVSFERIPVAKGTTDVGYTAITPLKEIPANAKIVVKNAFFVLAKMTNTGGDHAH